MHLLELQQRLLRSVVNNEEENTGQMNASERFEIYRNNYITKLTRALSLTYPVCARLVGNQFFDFLALKYIRKNPATSFSFDDYGATFAEFIADFAPAETVPYLADVARLEWFYHQCNIGPDIKHFDLQKFAKIADQQRESIVFFLPKNSKLLYSVYPLKKIWEVNQLDYEGEYTVDFDNESFLFIWRKNFSVKIEMLSQAEWQLLSLIAQQKTFAQICKIKIAGIDVSQQLPQFIANGWIDGFYS